MVYLFYFALTKLTATQFTQRIILKRIFIYHFFPLFFTSILFPAPFTPLSFPIKFYNGEQKQEQGNELCYPGNIIAVFDIKSEF